MYNSNQELSSVATSAAASNPTLAQLMKLERENKILKALVNPDEVTAPRTQPCMSVAVYNVTLIGL